MSEFITRFVLSLIGLGLCSFFVWAAIQAFRHGGDVAAAICVALALLEASRFNEYPFIKEREK